MPYNLFFSNVLLCCSFKFWGHYKGKLHLYYCCDNESLRRDLFLSKNHSTHGYTSPWLIRKALGASQTAQPTATALGILKIPHTLAARHRDINIKPTEKTASLIACFYSIKGTMLTAMLGEGCVEGVDINGLTWYCTLHAAITSCYTRSTHWLVQQWHALIWSPLYRTESHAW